MWDNLGRIAIEFAHLDEFCVEGFGRQTPDIITYPPESKERYDWITKSGKATIGFAAHLANWELPGVGAKLIGVKSAVLYRRPNIGAVSDVIIKLREPLMGELIPTGLDAPVKLAGCCNPASMSACSPTSTTAKASRSPSSAGRALPIR